MQAKTTKRKPPSNKLSALGIQPVSHIVRPRSWVIYGRSKTGKTTFFSTFPKPSLLLDINDRGTDSVSDVEGLYVKEVPDLDVLEEMYYFLKEGDHDFKSVALDTTTQLQNLVIDDVSASGRRRADRAGDWGTLTQRQWGDVAAGMKEYITRWRDLPMEVVFIAQDRLKNIDDEDDSDNTLVPEVGPAVMPSVALVMNAEVDIIGNTFIKLNTLTKEVKGKSKKIEKAVYALRIGPNPVYTTGIRKPRSIVPPPYIENPTYDDIMDIIQGEE